MKLLKIWISIVCLGLVACQSSQHTNNHSPAGFFEYQNPITAGIDPNGLRDCQVFREGDWWYMTGTSYPHWSRQENDGELNKGVALYKSKDLNNWQFIKYIVERPTKNKWYYRRFWAPEIHKINGKWYALFNARNDELGYVGQYLGYAVADNLEGPYKVVTEDKPLHAGNDLTFFKDDDGKVWAFWNQGKKHGIRFAQIDLATGQLLTKPTSAILPGKVDWQYLADGSIAKEPGYDGRPIDKVKTYHEWDSIGIEGAYVIKRQGTYYLFYSSWTRGYEIGYATASQITGPWTKSATNPFYGAQRKDTTLKRGFTYSNDPNSPFTDVGHNEIFTGPDGNLWLSAHGIVKGQQPMLVIDPLKFDAKGNIVPMVPSYTKQRIELP
ncbi:hypothetical protein C2869_03120 [Saccharobesus litoralis]|uniref:Glycosyl hydrolases family 43 n=1 Tax=Saccharobesus litoralis TaxID=2172099 RepID=A0A2S0VMQ5_9ALTE|nr:family 43 glycosylhydrolase [Saccharobesus litoralis]AWB65485.1 hypothetical protein C2869_03120 [Saccharobesus litoralis]